jgi:ferric-dicitrate binding protein FerR (iron transport regulator)
MDRQLSKSFLYTYFSGNATPLQKKMIEDWLEDKNNIEQFYLWLQEWETEHPQFIPNQDKALEHYLSRLENNEPQIKPLVKQVPQRQIYRRVGFSGWWIAATIAFICLASFLLKDTILYTTYATAYGEIKTLQLNDGSQVTLNANTVLQIPRLGFGKTSREVFLTGEAEFVVTHTINNERFVVKTPDHVEIEVLGTEFLVKSRDTGTKIALSKGKVKLQSFNGTTHPQPIIMRPGDIVEVNKHGKLTLQAAQPIQVHKAWKDHRFIFNNTSLQEIAEQIKETFGVQVIIPDTTLANRRVAGAYKAENANELLAVLSELLNMHISIDGKKVILTNQ